MRIIREIREMHSISRNFWLSKKTIGFVPTMGAFHQGHLSLMKKARLDCDTVVVSIFVNPIQFGPDEDYEQYPRDIDRDSSLASENGVGLIFAPDIKKFYPDNYCSYVDVEKLGNVLCGASRPGHFRGVTTVVAKLFNIVSPNVAYFGQKDYQQTAIIDKMVQDLCFDVKIEVLPIVRRQDGLAMSSRNAYLSKDEERKALGLFQSLKTAEKIILDGERDVGRVISQSRQVLEPTVKIDYLEICDSRNLQPLTKLKSGKILVALAAFIGKVRLIDNILLDVPT